MKDDFASIDEYVASFPEEVRQRLQEIRNIVRAEAPDAEERISYGMPTFFLGGNLVHFAAFRNHIGLYGTVRVHAQVEKEIEGLVFEKGTLRFSAKKPLPLDLIRKIVRLRTEAQRADAAK